MVCQTSALKAVLTQSEQLKMSICLRITLIATQAAASEALKKFKTTHSKSSNLYKLA